MDELEKKYRDDIMLRIKSVKQAEKILEKAKESLKTSEGLLVELLENKRID